MRRIKQGHTRWRLDVICGRDGHADVVYVYECIVVKSTWCAVHYFDGHNHRITSHWGWMQMYQTRRKAWRAAWRMVDETNRIRGAEYVAAWQEVK